MAYASDKKPSELTALSSLANDDTFVVGDTSDASEVAKSITKANLLTDFADETQTLTNKTIDTANNTLTVTEADISDLGSYITATSTDTLNNKTIDTASNTLTVVEADISDLQSYSLPASTETLTNKTIDADNNTVSNIGGAEFDTDTADMFELMNAAALDSPVVTVTSNGSTITLNLEKSGGGDIRFKFSDGVYTFDCTPTATVSLTAGTDTNPQINYIYVLQSNKTLTASTSGFPSAEHAPVATVLCQSAASLQTDGAYKVHAWTDHVANGDKQGHLAHLNYWIRQQPATWESGVALTPTGGASNYDIATTAGVVLQLHDHAYPAFNTATGSEVYVVNNNTTPYNKVTDLFSETADSTGTALGAWYTFVFWGAVNEASGDCKIYCNLPSGSYANNNSNQATNDTSQYNNYTIPADFTGVGFLIAAVTVSKSGSTITVQQNSDLRGLFPATAAGGGGGGGVSEFVQLTDTPSAYTSQANKLLQVASGETALEFTSTPTISNDNITEATNKNYVTDAEKTVIGNTSGTNTGDVDIDDLTPTTTKGDLLVENGSNVVRLPVGTNDYILKADSGQASGLIWGPAPSGTPEGTAILSTGEVGATKFLREDGDGTCSWQTVPAGGISNVSEDTTPQLGGDLDTNGNDIILAENDVIELDSANSADGKFTGIAIDGTAGATLAFGDIVYLAVADSRWELADASAVATAAGTLGICVLAAAADGNATKILLMGTVRADTAFPTLTVGAQVFLSETAGDCQTTAPSTTDSVVRVLGTALTANEMLWNPSVDHLTVV